jgi:hypothetical protein
MSVVEVAMSSFWGHLLDGLHDMVASFALLLDAVGVGVVGEAGS